MREISPRYANGLKYRFYHKINRPRIHMGRGAGYAVTVSSAVVAAALGAIRML